MGKAKRVIGQAAGILADVEQADPGWKPGVLKYWRSLQLYQSWFSCWDKHSENLHPCDCQHLFALVMHKENSALVGEKFLPDSPHYKKINLCFIVGKHFHSFHLTFSKQCCFLCTICTTNSAMHWVNWLNTCRNAPFWGKRTNKLLLCDLISGSPGGSVWAEPGEHDHPTAEPDHDSRAKGKLQKDWGSLGGDRVKCNK